MKKQAAVLLDLGHVLYKLYRPLGNRYASAAEVHAFASACISDESEERFRFYCYHCPPFGKTREHPLTRERRDFSQSPTFQAMTRFIDELETMEGVAFRAGELMFSGWKIRNRASQELIRTGRALAPEDLEPDLTQKMVDLKIGLDVAWLASKSLVERIIMVTGDTDLVPAMKFARREGVQVVLATIGNDEPNRNLRVHADLLRPVPYPPVQS